MTGKTTRIEWLDYMKGVAILIVVMGHVVKEVGEPSAFGNVIIVCEMPLFFMLSGILAKKITKRTILDNYKKKALSLGVPFITVGGVYAVCTGAVWYYLFDMYHWSYWFLLSLLECWLIFVPLLKWSKNIFKGETSVISELGGGINFVVTICDI